MQEENKENSATNNQSANLNGAPSVKSNNSAIYPEAKPITDTTQFNGVFDAPVAAPSYLMAIKPIVFIFLALTVSSYFFGLFFLPPLLVVSLFSLLLLIKKNPLRILFSVILVLCVSFSSYILYLKIDAQIGLNKKQADLTSTVNKYNNASVLSGVYNSKNDAFKNYDKAAQNVTDYYNQIYLRENIIGSIYILYMLSVFIYLFRPGVVRYYKSGKKENNDENSK